MRLIVDAHLDLSWNALGWDRDLTQPLAALREREASMTDQKARGNATITLGELRRGGVAVCFGTLLARALPPEGVRPPERDLGTPAGQQAIPPDGSPRRALDYPNQQHAHAAAQGQLAYYRQLEREGHFRLLYTREELDAHWRQWSEAGDAVDALPIGVIVAMEGADPIVTPEQAEQWHQQGLRAVGPVHYGRSAYAVGTGFDGAMTPAGHELLRVFERTGMILDVTHMSDRSFDDALEHFQGRVIASHHNCRALVPRDRQLSDDQIKRLVARDGVIGVALDAWMLHPDYRVGEDTGDVVTMEAVADHIDHVAQLAGSTRHSGIGSDLDGGFGREQTPADLDTIADLQKLEQVLARRGYSEADMDAIFHGNWLRLLRETMPA